MGPTPAWWALVVTLATMGNAHRIHVDSFTELNLAVASGAPIIEIIAQEIVFDHQLTVQVLRAPLLIESSIGATLSGGDQTRLFVLQNGTSLSLRGVRLESGMARSDESGAPSPAECPPDHGGAIFASEGSVLHLYSTHLSDNRADRAGGAIYAVSSTVTATNCTINSNTASSGGAVWAGGASTVTATNCTMASNSAHWGGAVIATGLSTITATDCTMTSNSASTGGAVYAKDSSAFTATDCTMTSNNAPWGGAFSADDGSTVTVTYCTMHSNTAWAGGAIAAVGYSIVTATGCTISSNSAYEGGAFTAADGSTVTATTCTMTSNSANSGGAVAVGGNPMRPRWLAYWLNDSTMILASCVLSSNNASIGAALFITKGGIADLANSIFQFNFGGGGDTKDGVGIVNLNGQVQCDAMNGCLPVCTVCLDEKVPSLPPTTQPMVQIHKRNTDGPVASVGTVLFFVFCLFGSLGAAVVMRHCGKYSFFGGDQSQSGNEDNGGVQVSLLQMPLFENLEVPSTATTVATGNSTAEHSIANDHTTTTSPNEDNEKSGNRASLPWSAIGSVIPAPMFAIDHKMRMEEPDDNESGKISVLESANGGVCYREVPCEPLASIREKRGRPTTHLLGSSGRDGIDGDAEFSVTSSINAPTGVTALSVVSSLSPSLAVHPKAHSEISSLTMSSCCCDVGFTPVTDELGDVLSGDETNRRASTAARVAIEWVNWRRERKKNDRAVDRH